MVRKLRRVRAGTDSFGNVLPTDGAVIEVSDDQADALIRIPDGGITEVFTKNILPDTVKRKLP
jgi:hypothetical protein